MKRTLMLWMWSVAKQLSWSLPFSSGVTLNCDNCSKMTKPACHLAMSDASIRNFCTLTCAMTFKVTNPPPFHSHATCKWPFLRVYQCKCFHYLWISLQLKRVCCRSFLCQAAFTLYGFWIQDTLQDMNRGFDAVVGQLRCSDVGLPQTIILIVN